MISPSLPSQSQAPPSSSTNRTIPYATNNPAALYDSALVRRFNDGDEAAFVEIVNRHRGKLLTLAFGHLHNRADAEEIAQDACVHAYRGLARFRGESSLASWLYRIVFNLSRNRCGYYLRRRRQDTCSLDSTIGEEGRATIADFIASDAPDPARDETNREFLALVDVCMKKLSPRQREILAMRNIVGHSYEEIAEILRINPGTVKSRIARARSCLRTLLAATNENAGSGSIPSLQWFDTVRRCGHMTAVSS